MSGKSRRIRIPKKAVKRVNVRFANRGVRQPVQVVAAPSAPRAFSRQGKSVGKRGGGMVRRGEFGDAEKYLQAVVSPFDDVDPLPGVPDEICVRTICIRAKMSATVAPTPTNTGGNYGQGTLVACLTPVYNVWTSITGASPPNTNVPSTNWPDMYPLCIANTNACFNSTLAQVAWSQGVQWEAAPEQLYPSTNNGGPGNDGVLSEARCVAAGMRISFTGNYQTTDGVLYAAVIPKNAIVPFFYYLQSIATGGSGTVATDESTSVVTAPRTFSEVLATFGVQAFSAQGGVEIHWVPEDPQSVTFTQIGKDAARRKTQIQMLVSSVDATGPTYSLGGTEMEQLNPIPSIFVWGANLNVASSYVIECTSIFEATLAPGLSSFLPSTPSPVDVVGFGKALRVAAAIPSAKPSPRSWGGALAQSGAMSQVRDIAGAGLRGVGGALRGMTGQTPGGRMFGAALSGIGGLLGKLKF
jgi:hypothetical protein